MSETDICPYAIRTFELLSIVIWAKSLHKHFKKGNVPLSNKFSIDFFKQMLTCPSVISPLQQSPSITTGGMGWNCSQQM